MSETDSTPDAPARELTDALKQRIRDTYRALQANTPGFAPRRAQNHMIAVASRALATSGGVGVVEAPTGVGKSLGYLTAGVPIALAANKKLVVSTGTVALQSQLVERDLPAFLAATGIAVKVALAKGRTRYLCTRNIAEMQGASTQDSMFEAERAWFDQPPSATDSALAKRLADAYFAQTWDGDLDATPEPVPASLRARITTQAAGCAGRRCAFAARCPVLKARQDVREAQIVVTNHALLLAALAQGDNDSGPPLLGLPQDMLLVLDEGHHLAGVAVDQGAANVPLADRATRLGRLQILIATTYRLLEKDKIGGLVPSEAIELVAGLVKQLRAMHGEIERVWSPSPDERDALWRAPNGRLPDAWRPLVESLCDDTQALSAWVASALQHVARSKDESTRDRLTRSLGMALDLIEPQFALWSGWRREDADGHPPTARWITRTPDADLVCHCSPVSAAQVLRLLLWSQVDSVLLTSATLTGGGGFRTLSIDTGLPAEAETVALDSPFDLPNQAELIVPPFPVTPDDREAHAREVALYLENELDWQRGSMVLFTSRWKMEKVLGLLAPPLRIRVLMQGDGNKSELIAEHLRRIGEGRGSVLFGLNSFGEGLDLPGEACTTVVITQVPFAVPTDPQTATLGEWLESRGQNPFNLIAIPHAQRMLTQFAGRLIRSATDHGRVIILDSRLLTRHYGRRILGALPPFRRVIG